MKISKFTSLHYHNGEAILFNSENERLIVLDSALEQIYKEHTEHPAKLEKIHPDFFNALKANRFIVPCDEVESKVLIERWKQGDENSRNFGIIINPTLNCNLRCWYCYESHKGKMVMSEKVRKSICRLIEEKTADPNIEVLNVSFFGGEPLLFFNETVLPILRFAAEKCQPKGITLYTNFTTNAVLLTNEIIEALNALPLGKKATFQITLDGNRETHDQIRVGTNKTPTYDTILENISSVLKHGNEVSLRFNYTYDNILTFADVLNDFTSKGLEKYYAQISVKFEHVWQDGVNMEKSKPLMLKMRDEYEKAGFKVGIDDIHYRHVCYADSPNHVVINYNGDVFKCTARDFTKDKREGILDENGHIAWNEKFLRRMAVRYGNVACRNCIILPICNGGCTQNKLDANNMETCFWGLTEEGKQEYLEKRVQEIIRHKFLETHRNITMSEEE